MVKPVILQSGSFTSEDVAKLKSGRPIWNTVDVYERQLDELFEVRNPGQVQNKEKLGEFKKEEGLGETAGAWVYYPWSGTLLHCIGETELFTLRTNRNQPLIAQEEQEKLISAQVGITGMSVGSSIALSIAYSGVSNHMKLADFDELSTSNLNRLREPLSAIGQPKINLAAQHIYEINPFADLELFDKGVHDDNIDEFFSNSDLDLVIDEIDDFKMKVKLRTEAKKRKIPLLMFTSLGDNILVDVERYDTDSELELFHGLIPGLSEEILGKEQLSEGDIKRYAVQLVGQQYIPTRALTSLPEIGKTLVGRPQLYSTIAVDGGLAAYLCRQILLDKPVKSGRYFVQFPELFRLDNDLEDTDERREVLERIFSHGRSG